MSTNCDWVGDHNVALLTDLYELTMLQGYWRDAMAGRAVFTLFVRRLPKHRNHLLAAGLDDALCVLETASFRSDLLEFLAGTGRFDPAFLEWLGRLRFTGDVFAVPEGTPVFAGEPILEVVAPIAEAQWAETIVMNQVHYQTVAASKAARVVEAAAGRTVVDFGLRRIHGADAGLKSARAFHIAGVDATSNVLAGRVYGVPLAGTMAHSYIQAFDREADAFRAFARVFPETVLLVDTYDTLEGVRRVIGLARELGPDFRVRGVRLDSGDLGDLARRTRALLDEAGLDRLTIFASGGLDEYVIGDLVAARAPIDGFGVGTAMGVSADAPALDIAYKLTAYEDVGRLKLSPGKGLLPGRKQVFRIEEDGRAVRDVIGRADEEHPGRPLLRHVMAGGRRLAAGRASLADARERARGEIARLPAPIRAVATADPPYPVTLSPALSAYRDRIAGEAARR